MELFLDHFYAGIDAKSFDEYSILGELIPGTEVRTTSSGDLTWSGVYPRSSSGVYMELIKRTGELQKAGLSLAFSGLGYEENIEENLRKQFPEIHWISNEVHLDGKEPWFWIVKPSDQEQEPRVWTWAMEFLGNQREKRRKRIGQENTPIESFVSMEMRFPPDLIDQMHNKWHQWVPGTRSLENGKYIVQILCYQSHDFTLVGTADPQIELPEVQRIVAKLKAGRSVQEYRGKSFRVFTSGGELIFEFLGQTI